MSTMRGRGLRAGACAVLYLAAAACVLRADELEKTSGAVYKGRFIEETDKAVVFEVQMGDRAYPMTFKREEVRALVVGGERRTLSAAQGAPAQISPAASAAPKDAPAQPIEEIRRLIAEAGASKPAWWDQEQTPPPPNLDVTWRTTGWKPNENIGTHMFIVCPDPARWRYAIKLLDRSLQALDASDLDRRRECLVLMGDFYARLEDWARAAWHWQQAGAVGSGDQPYGLILCYWKLGNKALAAQMLAEVSADGTRYAKAVRLWAQMGETDRAVALAEASARRYPGDPLYLAAGDAFRRAGDWTRAAQYYQKVLDLKSGSRELDRNRQRAAASLAAVQRAASFSVSAIGNGTAEGQGNGYRGPVRVRVEVRDGKVSSVTVVNESDDREFDAFRTVPERIVQNQGIAGVDAVTGATISSEAVLNGFIDALGRLPAAPPAAPAAVGQ